MKAPKLVTLADLRRAVPGKWSVTEERLLFGLLSTGLNARDGSKTGIHVYHKNRQICRRMALAAFKALKASR